MRRAFIAVTAIGLVAMGGAAPVGASTTPFVVIPTDGAHWQPGAGVPDANGGPNLGLVQTVRKTGDTDVADLLRLSVTHGVLTLQVAASTPAGIDPCWLVGIVDAFGTPSTIHLTLDAARPVGRAPAPGPGFAPYVVWSWTFNIPAGDTALYATLRADADEQPPPVGDRVAFDDFAVTG